MLKTLLKELGRSLRAGTTASPSTAAVDPHAQRKEAFQTASPEQRQTLAASLAAELNAGAQDVAGWTLLGDWLLSLQQHAHAEAAYRQALKIKPLHGRAQEGLGLALLYTQQLEEAYLRLETASKLDPMNADIWTHWGLVDLELGNLNRASEKFQRAIERDKSNPHAWHNLGLVAYKLGQVVASIDMLERAIDLKPDHGLAFSNLALALRRAERLDEALAAAVRATELKPNNARVWVVLADVRINAGDYVVAEQAIRQAIAIDSSHVGAHVALGKLHAARAEYEPARQAYEEALRLVPGHADAEGGLAEVQLLLGEWSTAWDLHEARRRVDASPVRNAPFLEYQGEQLDQHRVLVHAEQGLGDIILFASCIPELQARGANCVLEVRPRLKSLFARSFPHTQVVAHGANEDSLTWLSDLPPIDRHLPIGTLPRWFRRDAKAFPVHQGYLVPDVALVEAWRQRLGPHGHPTIAVAWRGGLVMTAKQQRTIELSELVKALAPTGARLVCIQYGETEADLAHVKATTGIDILPGISGFADLDELAALTMACDGVITVCSTQAHLTGALGQRGLVLVPANPNWRYGAAGKRSPWYPSLQLVRQTSGGHWNAAFQAAAQWVRDLPRSTVVSEPS